MRILSSIGDLGFALATFSGRIKRVEKKQDEIVSNYLQKFDEVKDRIRDSELRIIRENNDRHDQLFELLKSR